MRYPRAPMTQDTNRSMLLTQVRPAPPASTGDLSGVMAPGAEVTAFYRDVENPGAYALAQYFERQADRILGLPSLASLPKLADGTEPVRYACRELSDTGSYARTPQELAPILMIVAFDVPDDYEQEVERWYAEEHIPLLMRAPGWMRARRYQAVHCHGGRRFTSIALHELRDLAVLDSKERAFARSTEWRARLSPLPWFEAAGRFIYERIPA